MTPRLFVSRTGAVVLCVFLVACGSSPDKVVTPVTGGDDFACAVPLTTVAVNVTGDASSLACIAQPTPHGGGHSVKAQNAVTDFTMNVANIMPPGNDGHISVTTPGCANDPDACGPHFDDQREMYWNSQFKDGAFTDVSGLTAEHTLDSGNGNVSVYRADFDVPVIHGDSGYAIWYGAGYVTAQDRLFLMDAALRQGSARFAAITGAGDVAVDVQRKTLRYTEAEYQSFYDNLSTLAKDALDGYVAGANAWIDRVNDPLDTAAEKPQEMVALQYDPAHVNPLDVLALGVFMTRFVAANGGDEMANVRLLQELTARHGKETARKMFRDLLWVDDKKATVTITDTEFTNISTPAALREAVLEQAMDYAETLPLELEFGPGTGHFPEPSPVQAKLPEDFEWPYPPEMLKAALDDYQSREKTNRISASYQVTVNDAASEGDSTLILSAPQLGYSYPTLFYELEVVGGGYAARGVGVPGLPVVGIGYGTRVAWALTTGESKTIDSFVVELTDDPSGEIYLHNGIETQMDCRDESIQYRGSANGVPAGPVGANTQSFRVCRTVHGPVVARSDDGQYARAVQYGMWMKEIDTIDGVLGWAQAQNFDEFYTAMSKVTWNENTMYADADGNIAYFHPGLHPWRHPSYDQRLPANGDGSQDHCDTLTFENTPHSVNPPRGFMHNWNNKPAAGWGDGPGGVASQEPGAIDGRNRIWEELLNSEVAGAVDGHGDDITGVNYDDLFDFDKRIGRIDPKTYGLLDVINSCAAVGNPCQLSVKQAEMLTELQNWDSQHYNDAIDPLAAEDAEESKDTAAATIFSAIVQSMTEELFRRGVRDDAVDTSPLAQDTSPGSGRPAGDPDDVLPFEFVQRHEARGNHPYDVGTFHKLLTRIFKPQDSSISLHYDWLDGRCNEDFLKAAFDAAQTQLEAEYGAATAVSDYKRMHSRADVCGLANPLAGPCITMPHQDRGSWIHIIEFDPN